MVALRARSLAIAFAVLAVACGVMAFIERHVTAANASGIGIEGVYFNRSEGAPAYAGVVSSSGNWFSPVKLLNPYLWAGAGVAFLIVSITLAVFVVRPQEQ